MRFYTFVYGELRIKKEENLRSMKNKLSKIMGVGLALVMIVTLSLALAVPATAVSAPSVKLSTNLVGTAATVNVSFRVLWGLSPTTYPAGAISVEFPSDMYIPSSVTDGKVIVRHGTTSAACAASAGNTTLGVTVSDRTLTIPVPEAIADFDYVTVTFPIGLGPSGTSIKNATTGGYYYAKVMTTKEPDWVTSGAMVITTPLMVTHLSSAGVLLGYATDLAGANALIAGASSYDKFKFGAGTYYGELLVPKAYLTIEAEAGAKISGSVNITGYRTTLDGFSVYGNSHVSGSYSTLKNLTLLGTVNITASDVTVVDSSLSKTYYTSSGETLLTSTGDRTTVTNCTIDTTYRFLADTGIDIAGGDYSTISGCTFTTDYGTTTTQDKALAVTGAANSLTVTGNTLNGEQGAGVSVEAGAVAFILDNTFEGYNKAIDVPSGSPTLSIKANTITNSALYIYGGAINIASAGGITITGNTIVDNGYYSVYVSGSAANVTLVGNDISGNYKGLNNTTTTALNAINNWWGDVSGPTTLANPLGTGEIVSTYVNFLPWLTSSVSAGSAGTGSATVTSLDASTTVGVKVEGLAVGTLAAATKYAANPLTVEPTYTPLEDAWFDVYVSGTAPTSLTIKFYADGIDSNTDAYTWSALKNMWVACSAQGASSSGGYVWITVTSTTTPALDDMGGMPFVLVDAPAAAKPTLTLTAPTAAATMPLTNVPFTWDAVALATDYELVLSAKADLSGSIAAVTADMPIPGTAYTYTGTLEDATPYYWQVTALKDGYAIAKSNVATFIAKTPAAEVVLPTPVVTVEAPAAPEVTVEVEAPAAPSVTVTMPEEEAPPTPGYIWAIIIIGAVLVIAMIVLIVRTRRAV